MKQIQRKLGENSLGSQPSGCWEDNGRAAVRTPQVSSGNGLLTKPYYPARFLPMQSVPSHTILIIIPSNALGKGCSKQQSSWTPRIKSEGKDAPTVSNHLSFYGWSGIPTKLHPEPQTTSILEWGCILM